MARRAGRGLVAITLCLTALGAGTSRATAAPTATTAAPIPPLAWIVADAGSGEVLDSHADHTPLPPASTTKIMTALTAVERLPPDTPITVSALAASQPASKISMHEGERWKLSDALASLMVVSANDAAYAIAESTSGSVADFAKAETETGRQLGLRDSTFADPAGLDDGNAFRGGPLMSAYDIAITTRNALRVPVIANLAASAHVSFTGPDGMHHELTNHNRLVTDNLYAGITGFKTGFTNKAQRTLVATATRSGRTLIVVVLGTYDAYGWATRLLDVGFSLAPGHGTGVRLPAPRVTTYAARATQFAAMRRLATGNATVASTPRATQASATNPTSASTAATAGTGAAAPSPNPNALAASDRTARTSGKGGGLSTRTILILVFVLILATLYVLRVRAVRRQRARRLARRRATNAMMRRGGLPVVDGRYRTGTRVGKPVEGHVQVRRSTETRASSAR
jgi:D-alanyl-D-alanine carboxypeptidase (penicillin-binding protein 5/6)